MPRGDDAIKQAEWMAASTSSKPPFRCVSIRGMQPFLKLPPHKPASRTPVSQRDAAQLFVCALQAARGGSRPAEERRKSPSGPPVPQGYPPFPKRLPAGAPAISHLGPGSHPGKQHPLSNQERLQQPPTRHLAQSHSSHLAPGTVAQPQDTLAAQACLWLLVCCMHMQSLAKAE